MHTSQLVFACPGAPETRRSSSWCTHTHWVAALPALGMHTCERPHFGTWCWKGSPAPTYIIFLKNSWHTSYPTETLPISLYTIKTVELVLTRRGSRRTTYYTRNLFKQHLFSLRYFWSVLVPEKWKQTRLSWMRVTHVCLDESGWEKEKCQTFADSSSVQKSTFQYEKSCVCFRSF